jgi:hypothetical protein
MFQISNSSCAKCRGHIHGPGHAVGTNLCCLSGFSHDPERDIYPHKIFPPSEQMLAVASNGNILRGNRSLHKPHHEVHHLKRARFKTSPPATLSSEYIPPYDVEDPFHPRKIVPYNCLPLNGNVSLIAKVTSTSKALVKPQFDDWLPPEERLSLRRFMTEKAAHLMDRNIQQTSGQWWEHDGASTTTEEDSVEDLEDREEFRSRDGSSSWVKRGKKMHKVEADRVTLSPRERFFRGLHNSGGGICLSKAHRWLRRASSTIITIDAGKKGMRNVNALEYCLRKYEHALRCKSYSEAAKHWHDEYKALTMKSNWKFYNDHLYRRMIDAYRGS